MKVCESEIEFETVTDEKIGDNGEVVVYDVAVTVAVGMVKFSIVVPELFVSF